MIQVLITVLVIWWVIHFLRDLFGGTPGAYRHKDLGEWNTHHGPVMKDYKEGTIDTHIPPADKALIWRWIAYGMIGLAMWGVGALAYVMLCMP